MSLLSSHVPRVLLCSSLLMLALLVGCAAPRGDGTFRFEETRYSQAFDAAREVLREHQFQLNRVDVQAGVLTSAPKYAGGLATPWNTDQSSLRQEIREYVNHEQRRVRIVFSPQGSPTHGEVEVTIDRVQKPGLRAAPRAIAMTSYTIDPAQVSQGVGFQHEVPHSRDSALEARLARAIEARVARPEEPNGK